MEAGDKMMKAKDAQMQFDLDSEADAASLIDKPLSKIAKKLLKILPSYEGKANAINASYFAGLFKVEARAITSGISELREHGYPVCSSRDDGYWWSTDPVEFNEYLNKQEKENDARIRRTRKQRKSPLGQKLIANNNQHHKDQNRKSIGYGR